MTTAAQHKAWVKKNRAHVRAYLKRYALKHHKRIAAQKKAYDRRNRKRKAIYNAVYRLLHKNRGFKVVDFGAEGV